MSFKIKKRTGQTGWSVYKHIGSNRWVYVPQGAWPQGLQQTFTLDDARTFAKSLTAAKNIEKKRTGILEQQHLRLVVASAWLPHDVVSRFERVVIEPNLDRCGKTVALWKATQRIIQRVNTSPQDWRINPNIVYKVIAAEPKSVDWAGRLLRMINNYGFTYSDTRGLAWQPLPKMPERYLVAIHDMAEQAGIGQKSLPISFDNLAKLRGKLKLHHWNWCNIAFWFGLRPEEVDQIRRDKTKWSVDGDVLKIWQPKLRKIKYNDRFKYIPAELPQQLEALKIILSDARIQRPSRAVVKRAYPDGVTNYGFRHGFTSYMDELDKPMELVSRWLGHKHLSTTETYYRNMNLVKRSR